MQKLEFKRSLALQLKHACVQSAWKYHLETSLPNIVHPTERWTNLSYSTLRWCSSKNHRDTKTTYSIESGEPTEQESEICFRFQTEEIWLLNSYYWKEWNVQAVPRKLSHCINIWCIRYLLQLCMKTIYEKKP